MSMSDVLLNLPTTLQQLAGAGDAVSALVSSWLLTYALHSTLLVAAVWLLASRLPPRAHQLRDALWKVAMAGALLTTSWQVASGVEPLGGRFTLRRVAAATLPAGVSRPLAPAAVGSGDEQRAAERAMSSAASSTTSRMTSYATTFQRSSPEPRPAAYRMAYPTPRGARPGAARARGRERRAGERWLQPAAAAPAPATQAAAGNGPPGPRDPAPNRLQFWMNLLLFAWVAGATVGLLRLAGTWIELSRRFGRRRPIETGPLAEQLAQLRAAAGVRRRIRLTCSPRVPSPIALFPAEICVPERVLTRLSPAQQRSVLAHELAHLVRRDPFWLLAGQLVHALLFFQPLHRVVRRQLRETAEYLCDDWAVQRTGCRLSLARCLAEVATWLDGGARPAAVAGMAAPRSTLLRRVQRLLDDRRPDEAAVLRRWQAPAVVLLLLAGGAIAPRVAAVGVQPPAPATAASHPTPGAAPSAAAAPTRQRTAAGRRPIIIGPDDGERFQRVAGCGALADPDRLAARHALESLPDPLPAVLDLRIEDEIATIAARAGETDARARMVQLRLQLRQLER